MNKESKEMLMATWPFALIFIISITFFVKLFNMFMLSHKTIYLVLMFLVTSIGVFYFFCYINFVLFRIMILLNAINIGDKQLINEMEEKTKEEKKDENLY